MHHGNDTMWSMGGLRALLAVVLVLGPRGGCARGGCRRLSNGTRLFLAERCAPLAARGRPRPSPACPALRALAGKGVTCPPAAPRAPRSQASSGLSWATDLVGAGDGAEEQCRRRRGLGADWDLTLVHASFSACSVPAWINDTERFQVASLPAGPCARRSAAGAMHAGASRAGGVRARCVLFSPVRAQRECVVELHLGITLKSPPPLSPRVPCARALHVLHQVGEHSEFSISREDCAREGQFAPPAERDRLLVFVDYRLPDVQHYPYVHTRSYAKRERRQARRQEGRQER